MYFDGSIQKAKVVTLRGNSTTPQSREVLRDQARKEREERALFKKKTFSALKIASTWKRYVARQKILNEIHEDLTNKIDDIKRIQQQFPDFSIPVNVFVALLRMQASVCYIRGGSLDTTLWLFQSLVNLCRDSKTVDDLISDRYLSTTTRFLSTVLYILAVNRPDDGIVASSLNQAMWEFFGLQPVCGKFASLLLVQSPLIHSRGYSIYSALVSKAVSISVMVTLASQGVIHLIRSNDYDESNQQLSFVCIRILSQSLTWLTSNGIDSQFTNDLDSSLWTKYLAICTKYTNTDAASTHFLENIFYFQSKFVISDHEYGQLQYFWKSIELAIYCPGMDREFETGSNQIAISYLLDPFQIEKHFRVALDFKSHEMIKTMCNIYEWIHHRASKFRTSDQARGSKTVPLSILLTSSIAFCAHGRIVHDLWDVLLEGNKITDSTWHLSFKIVVDTTTTLISALDDDELFVQERPFTRQELVLVAKFCCSYIMQRLSATTVSRMTRENDVPLEKIIKLFNELYVRLSRHNMLQGDEWQFSDIPDEELGITKSATIRASIRLADRDGDTIMEDTPLSQVSQRVRSILHQVPQLVPFNQRVQILHRFLFDNADPHEFGPVMEIRRSHLWEDAFDWAMKNWNSLRSRFRISFFNNMGLPEAGIDGGGVFKEFLLDFFKEAFDPSTKLWEVTQDNKLYPKPTSEHTFADFRDRFRFIGAMVAKAIRQGISLEFRFAEFFLSSVLGKQNHVHDLHSLDQQVYRNLMLLRQSENPEELELTFSIADENGKTIPLIENGTNICVTRENRMEYIKRFAFFKLNHQCKNQCDAFREGFQQILPVEWIKIFRPSELEFLISGSDDGFQIEDMKANAAYGNGYHPSQPYIMDFWEVLAEFDPVQKGLLLKFVTSCSRPPLLGFKSLNPPITISQVRIQSDSERLPTASTCVNLLKLPLYSSKLVLKEKLLYSIMSASGFELS